MNPIAPRRFKTGRLLLLLIILLLSGLMAGDLGALKQ